MPRFSTARSGACSAAQLGARFVIVSCDAHRQMMAERIKERRQAGIDPSEADGAVLNRQLQNMQPLRPDELVHTVTANTSQTSAYENTLAAIHEHLAPTTAVRPAMKATSHPTRPLL